VKAEEAEEKRISFML